MGHSFKVLKANFNRYFDVFYGYMLKFIYYGSVPLIVLYGKTIMKYKHNRIVLQTIQPFDLSFMGMVDRTRISIARYVWTTRRHARILLIWFDCRNYFNTYY